MQAVSESVKCDILTYIYENIVLFKYGLFYQFVNCLDAGDHPIVIHTYGNSNGESSGFEVLGLHNC